MKLLEGLDHLDMAGLISSKVAVDEYAAKMGDDDEIVTLSFTVTGHQVAEDLVSWFERGYPFILDAQVSDGELDDNVYLVFVEMSRRSKIPKQIVRLISDLRTLTDRTVDEYTLVIGDDECDVNEEMIAQLVPLSPREYRLRKDASSNDVRNLAGIEPKAAFETYSPEVMMLRNNAGL